MRTERSLSSLTAREQVSALRHHLRKRLGLDRSVALPLINHGFNTTFRLRHRDQDLAIRINVSSGHDVRGVRGELELVSHIAETAGLRVPQPQPLFDGDLLGLLAFPGEANSFPVVAYTWLEGRHWPSAPPAWAAIGRAFRQLHRATVGFQLSENAERRVLNDCLDGVEGFPEIADFQQVTQGANGVLGQLGSVPRQLVHFDLHEENVKFHQGQIGVFDFDDAVWAWPAADVAQILIYIRSGKDPLRAEEGFWEALDATPADMGVTTEELEFLVAARGILLAGSVRDSTNPEIHCLTEKYLESTRIRVSHFLDTGRFDPTVSRAW